MEIRYLASQGYMSSEEPTEKLERIEDFVFLKTLTNVTLQGLNYDREDVRLEHKANKVCEMVGRLIETLTDKGLLNLQDLLDITQPENCIDPKLVNDK